ncbi:hypothetical protein [Micromonospora sp. NPDC049679]|uniref:hypothetical protein n=1 Tax=Micromonospora sp. NPDC049679 TaxID=3155920 RepID=UPI0033C66912
MITRAAPRPHVPQRPLRLCRACAHPWPCGPARLTLTAEYAEDPVALCVYLCAQLHEAVSDLHKLNPYSGKRLGR